MFAKKTVLSLIAMLFFVVTPSFGMTFYVEKEKLTNNQTALMPLVEKIVKDLHDPFQTLLVAIAEDKRSELQGNIEKIKLALDNLVALLDVLEWHAVTARELCEEMKKLLVFPDNVFYRDNYRRCVDLIHMKNCLLASFNHACVRTLAHEMTDQVWDASEARIKNELNYYKYYFHSMDALKILGKFEKYCEEYEKKKNDLEQKKIEAKKTYDARLTGWHKDLKLKDTLVSMKAKNEVVLPWFTDNESFDQKMTNELKKHQKEYKTAMDGIKNKKKELNLELLKQWQLTVDHLYKTCLKSHFFKNCNCCISLMQELWYAKRIENGVVQQIKDVTKLPYAILPLNGLFANLQNGVCALNEKMKSWFSLENIKQGIDRLVEENIHNGLANNDKAYLLDYISFENRKYLEKEKDIDEKLKNNVISQTMLKLETPIIRQGWFGWLRDWARYFYTSICDMDTSYIDKQAPYDQDAYKKIPFDDAKKVIATHYGNAKNIISIDLKNLDVPMHEQGVTNDVIDQMSSVNLDVRSWTDDVIDQVSSVLGYFYQHRSPTKEIQEHEQKMQLLEQKNNEIRIYFNKLWEMLKNYKVNDSNIERNIRLLVIDCDREGITKEVFNYKNDKQQSLECFVPNSLYQHTKPHLVLLYNLYNKYVPNNN